MQDEPNLDNQGIDGEAPQPEGGTPASNRTFILLAIPLVLVFLCIAGALAYYALVMAPASRHTRETQVASVIMQNNTQIAIQTEAAKQPPTPTMLPTLALPTETQVPPATAQPAKTAEAGSVASPTPLLAVTASNTPLTAATSTPAVTAAGAVGSPTPLGSATKISRSATPAKSATPLVGGLKTATPTQLPGTGFADEAGVPMLIVVALGLVVVAVVVRRLRVSLR